MPPKRKAPQPTRERWYYDACVLDRSPSDYGEIINRKLEIQAVISHSAIGEAYGNALHKGVEQAEACQALFQGIREYVEVVQNDGCDAIFSRVRDVFPRLQITDALHLAIAIQQKCVLLITTDRDFLGLPAAQVTQLAQDFGLGRLTIRGPIPHKK